MLSDYVKCLARVAGLELRRFGVASSPTAQMRAMLAAQRIDTVFDVGANAGQFGWQLRRHVRFQGRIVSFEPMRAAYEQLQRAAAGDALWDVAPRAAVGAEPGTATLNLAGNSVSSSILPMLESHASAVPESRYAATESVPVVTLDSVADDYLAPQSRLLLKIDTQGYESQVLQGGPRTLARATGVQLELSLIPLYAGQKLMPELIACLQEEGFELWSLVPAFVEPVTGRTLQVDATFFRTGGPDSSTHRPAGSCG